LILKQGSAEVFTRRTKRKPPESSTPRTTQRERRGINITIAKAYLAGADPKLVGRTWDLVMQEYCSRGKESTRIRNQRAIRSKPFNLIRDKKLIETTADDLRAVMKAGGAFTNHFLRCLHNSAVGMGWLLSPVIPPKLWPKSQKRPKRGITWEEHQKIVQNENNAERKHYYELLFANRRGELELRRRQGIEDQRIAIRRG